MSTTTVTSTTTDADRYMSPPGGGVSHSKWNIEEAKKWEAQGKYLILTVKTDASKKSTTGREIRGLPKVNSILNETTRNVTNKNTGRKEIKTTYRKLFLPYIPVAWILEKARDQNLGINAAAVKKLAVKLNAVASELNIKWEGKATKHLPVRIGGHLSKLSEQLREYGLDFTFKTNPGQQESAPNSYNFEIIDKFSFHGNGILAGKSLRANVSEDDSWIAEHPYGKIWTREHNQVEEANLFHRIVGPDGQLVNLDDFHYFNKTVVGNPSWSRQNFGDNFIFSNSEQPERMTIEQAKATTDPKKSTVLGSLAENLAGAKSIHKTTTLVGNQQVPTQSLFFGLNKAGALELSKLSWKSAEDAPKSAYLLPKFTLRPYTSGKITLPESTDVNANGNRDLYISLIRQVKVPVKGQPTKSTTALDMSYDPFKTLTAVKEILGPHIVDSESYFRMVETELHAAVAKAAELRTKKTTSTAARTLFGATQAVDKKADDELKGKEIADKDLPEEEEEEESL